MGARFLAGIGYQGLNQDIAVKKVIAHGNQGNTRFARNRFGMGRFFFETNDAPIGIDLYVVIGISAIGILSSGLGNRRRSIPGAGSGESE